MSNRHSYNISQLFSAVFLLASAIYLSIAWRSFFPLIPDMVLVFLVVFAFRFGFYELLILTALSSLFLDWTPGIALETVVLFSLPILLWSLKNKFYRLGTTSIPLATIGSTLMFYIITSPGEVKDNIMALLLVMALNAIVAVIIHSAFQTAYPNENIFENIRR